MIKERIYFITSFKENYMSNYTQNEQMLQELVSFLYRSEESIFGKQKENIDQGWDLFFGEIYCHAKHRISQILLSLGLGQFDWSKWYRFFKLGKFKEEEASKALLKEVFKEEEGKKDPLVVVVDGVKIPRSSKDFPGVMVQPCPYTLPWKRGFWYVQRFVNVSYLTRERERGYSHAIPLRMLPAFSQRSEKLPEGMGPKKVYEVALEGVDWLIKRAKTYGYLRKKIVAVGDGEFDQNEIWKNLPKDVIWVARTKRNRSLYNAPPEKTGKKGRPKSYGEKASKPHEFARKRKDYKEWVRVIRGKERKVFYKIKGPFFVEGVPSQALFLLVISGKSAKSGGKGKRKGPHYFLVNGVREGKNWKLPLEEEELIYWQWQRWEVEVCHREMKSGFGLGDKQCWNPLSSVLTVQWSAWVYAVLRWFGYKHTEVLKDPVYVGKWYKKKRESIQLLLQSYRIALWKWLGEEYFLPYRSQIRNDMAKNQTVLSRILKSALSAWNV